MTLLLLVFFLSSNISSYDPLPLLRLHLSLHFRQSFAPTLQFLSFVQPNLLVRQNQGFPSKGPARIVTSYRIRLRSGYLYRWWVRIRWGEAGGVAELWDSGIRHYGNGLILHYITIHVKEVRRGDYRLGPLKTSSSYCKYILSLTDMYVYIYSSYMSEPYKIWLGQLDGIR